MTMELKRPGPKLKTRTGLNGGNRKPQTFRICVCGKEFGPLATLKQRFCSKRCAYDHAPKTAAHKHVRTKEAARAQRYLAYCIESGKIVKPSQCEKCASTSKRIEGAHFNYQEPLRVRWLCRSCHVKWDKAEPKGGTQIVARWEKYTGKKAELTNG
jgi:hypothetical protein